MPKPASLSYDAPLPPFLQRLKANHAAADGRGNVQQLRPGASRLRGRGDDADDDDGPVVVDEHGEVLAVKVGDAGEVLNGSDGDLGSGEGVTRTVEREEKGKVDGPVKESRTQPQPPPPPHRKRRVGKVVGLGADGDGDGDDDTVAEAGADESSNTNTTTTAKRINAQRVGHTTGGVVKPKPKPKKKAKMMVALSFDEPELEHD